MIKIQPAKKDTYIDIKQNEEEEDDEEEDLTDINVEEISYKKQKVVGHKNRESNVLEIINDKTCNRNTKILELTNVLDNIIQSAKTAGKDYFTS